MQDLQKVHERAFDLSLSVLGAEDLKQTVALGAQLNEHLLLAVLTELRELREELREARNA